MVFRLLLLLIITPAISQQADLQGLTSQMTDLLNQGKYEKIRPLALESLELAIQLENDTAEVKCLYFLAISFVRNDLGEAIVQMEKAKWKSYETDDFNLLNVLDGLATLYRMIGNYSQSIATCHDALRFVQNNPDPLKSFDLYRNLANNYREIKGYDSAFFYLIAAEEITSSSNNLLNKYLIKQLQANLQEEVGNKLEARRILMQLVEIAALLERTDFLATTTLNLGINYLELNELDSAQMFLENAEKLTEDSYALCLIFQHLGRVQGIKERYNSAIVYYQKSLEAAKRAGSQHDVAIAQAEIGKFYLALNEIDSASTYLHRGVDQATKLNYYEVLETCYYQLFELFDQQDRKREALDFYISYHNIADSLKNEKRIEALDELQTKYETEKKQGEISQLTQRSKIQQLTIQQNRVIALVIVLFLLVLILILFFVYRHRANRQLLRIMESDQRLLRAQMNPHFFFNALTSIQNLLLEKKDTLRSSNYISQFAQLMRKTLESSREEMISIEEEIELLENYLQIEQLRYDDRFSYSIKSMDEPHRIFIPPMLGQPMIENAIEHAFKGLQVKGEISISFTETSSNLIYEIEDNGVGFDTSNKDPEHKSLATQITKERIALFNKQKNHASFQVKAKEGEAGVTITFTLPLIRE